MRKINGCLQGAIHIIVSPVYGWCAGVDIAQTMPTHRGGGGSLVGGQPVRTVGVRRGGERFQGAKGKAKTPYDKELAHYLRHETAKIAPGA